MAQHCYTHGAYRKMRFVNRSLNLIDFMVEQFGLLRQGFGFTKADANRCAIEADHVHNLPGLIENYSTIALRYYLDVARPEYCRLAANEPGMIKLFEPAWSQLDEYARADR